MMERARRERSAWDRTGEPRTRQRKGDRVWSGFKRGVE